MNKTLPGVDGYLGPATLQAKRIEFDFGVKVLRWQWSVSSLEKDLSKAAAGVAIRVTTHVL
jgi:hypothetical protein